MEFCLSVVDSMSEDKKESSETENALSDDGVSTALKAKDDHALKLLVKDLRTLSDYQTKFLLPEEGRKCTAACV